MPKICIYTACFGEHDKPQELTGSGVDQYCFTDSDLKRSTWDVRYMRPRFRQARMDAKWFKMSACHLFPNYDYSIYVDSSLAFHQAEGFVQHCLLHLSSSGLAFYSHPEGQRSLEDEALFSLTFPKYHGEPLEEQVSHYRRAGLRETMLYAGGVIVRKHDLSGECFEKAWFDECVHWSVQDQLSLPYVLWRHAITPGVLPGSIYENAFFKRVWAGPER